MTDLRLATNPFLNEKQRAYWGKIERRVQEKYGIISLPEFIENELNYQTLTGIAAELEIKPSQLSNLFNRIGKITKNPELKELKLRFIDIKDLSDITELDIIPLSVLSIKRRKIWKPIEEK